jgi:hypothetical protein
MNRTKPFVAVACAAAGRLRPPPAHAQISVSIHSHARPALKSSLPCSQVMSGRRDTGLSGERHVWVRGRPIARRRLSLGAGPPGSARQGLLRTGHWERDERHDKGKHKGWDKGKGKG